MGVYVLLSPYYPEFNSYTRTVYSMTFSNFQLIEIYHNLRSDFFANDLKLATISFFIIVQKVLTFTLGISLAVNLYKQAMAFEKGHNIQNPDKQSFIETIEEIHNKVEEIADFTGNTDTNTGFSFKNQKIIAWLLNRNKEA